MKTLGMAALVIFALIGVIASGFFALAAYETQTSKFGARDELWASGLVERGWIPAHIPMTANTFVESHDVSSNSGSATFGYDPADMTLIRENCRALAENDLGSKFLCPPFDHQSFVVVLRRDGTGTWVIIPDAI